MPVANHDRTNSIGYADASLTCARPRTLNDRNTVAFTALPSPTAVHTSKSLSTGAKAGIGVGTSLVGLLVVALIVWACMRRRAKMHRARGVALQQGKPATGKDATREVADTSRSELHQDSWSPEADSKPLNELPVPPAEMEAFHAAELDGNPEKY